MSREYITNIDVELSTLPYYDCVIIGSGAAGLMTALTLKSEYQVLLLTKSEPTDSNSSLAQGGIAAALSEEDIDLHIADTMVAGCNVNDETAVADMISRSADAVDLLLDYGVPFDRDEDDELLVTREGGHSARRVLHYKDTTGKAIVDSLLSRLPERSNISLVSGACVADILTHEKKAVGVSYLLGGRMYTVAAGNVVLATGGIGGLFKATTNTATLTGDGLAMSVRAGASVKDLEFIQFHPTAYSSDQNTFLISEAVRGEGGFLVNDQGQRFMKALHAMAELAPRNIVSKAMFDQMQAGNQVYLDVRHLGPFFEQRFPSIYANCLDVGIDPLNELVPVQPVQHYIMGGIETDPQGRTAIEGLYACGEVAWTGVHGANRLASNSLLEAVVYGQAVSSAINETERKKPVGSILYQSDRCSVVLWHEMRENVQKIVTEAAFIVRSAAQIEEGLHHLHNLIGEVDQGIVDTPEAVEVCNMIVVAERILQAALKRKGTIGSHIRTDEGENT